MSQILTVHLSGFLKNCFLFSSSSKMTVHSPAPFFKHKNEKFSQTVIAQCQSHASFRKHFEFWYISITGQVALSWGNVRWVLHIWKWENGDTAGSFMLVSSTVLFEKLKTQGPQQNKPFLFQPDLSRKGSVERKWVVTLTGCRFLPIVWSLCTSCRHFTF